MSKVSIIYWSGTGNTEKMANLIMQGAKEEGANVLIKTVDKASIEDLNSSDILALGCPSMGDEVLEESLFEPFIESIKDFVSGKKLALFGSYGWGDGKWMRDWAERMKNYGAILLDEGLIINDEPLDDDENKCIEYGKAIKNFK